VSRSRCKGRFVLALVALAHAYGQPFDEYQVKAAFLANFADFIEWPAAAFHAPADPFAICVVGRNPFGGALTDVVAGKLVNGRGVKITELSDAAQASMCQIVFISASERLRFRSILLGLGTFSVLTVGDTSDFIAEGGMIALNLDNGRVRIQINTQPAKNKNLRISSRLLNLAERPK
jgi:hypothetical protein